MNQQKKIVVLVINCLQGGGAERSVLTLGQGFYELGYEVHIVRFKPLVEYDLNPNLHYHLIRFKPYKVIPNKELRHRIFAKKLDKYTLRKIGRPDIVLSNLRHPDAIMSYSTLPNIAYINHNTISLQYDLNNEKVKKQLINIYSKHPCVNVSNGVKNDFIDSLGEVTPAITIKNPIDRSEIQKLASEFVPEYKNYIIHVGSFKEVKRHDVLLKAYAKTNRSMPLLLLGQGKRKDEITRLVFDLGLSENVFLLGFKKNVYPYIKHAKFKVLTSSREGLPMVILEALAVGTPVISTDCQSGPREMLPEKNLMPVNDIDAISKKISEAMQDPAQFSSSFDTSLLPIEIARKHISFIQRSSG